MMTRYKETAWDGLDVRNACSLPTVYASMQAEEIASNSFWFVVDNLLPDKQYCYIYTLLNVSTATPHHWVCSVSGTNVFGIV